MIAKYIKKDDIDDDKLNKALLKLFKSSSELSNLSKWLNVFLKICQNVGVKLSDESISSALKICESGAKRTENAKEKEKGKEDEKENSQEYSKCVEMLKKY